MDTINKNAEREGQPGSREQGAWGKKHRAQGTELRAKPRKLCALSPERISKTAAPLALC